MTAARTVFASQHATRPATCVRPVPFGCTRSKRSGFRSRLVRGAAPQLVSETSLAVPTAQQVFEILSSPTPLVLDIATPWGFFSPRTPSFFSVLTYLLAHPFVTFSLALFLYFTVPRLWRAFVRFVVLPASLLAAGLVVAKNPQTFANAGTFVSHFTHDHPYVTSATILVGLTLVLSPYLLTALLVLFLATGIPRLPAPLQRLLPTPVVEVQLLYKRLLTFMQFEQQLVLISDATRGPVNTAKEEAVRLGQRVQSAGSRFFQNQLQASKQTPALSKSSSLQDGQSAPDSELFKQD